MSPRIGPRPADVRYQVVVTEISHEGTREVLNETGDAYIAGVATLTGNRIDAPVNHDGEQILREHLVAYIAASVYPD